MLFELCMSGDANSALLGENGLFHMTSPSSFMGQAAFFMNVVFGNLQAYLENYIGTSERFSAVSAVLKKAGFVRL